jgi:hypothetical protein
MVEEIKKQPVPDILTQVSKEKFRRVLLISTRVIAMLLVLAIVWIGFLQLTYVKEVNQIRGNYGSLGYCYMCGLETYRICSCQYRPDLERTMGDKILNMTAIAQETALMNTIPCPDINTKPLPFNTTFNVSRDNDITLVNYSE